MDGILLDLIGVILQVLGLIAAFGSLTVGVASLALQARLKDTPRSSQKDEPGPNKHPNRRSESESRGEYPLPAARLPVYAKALRQASRPPGSTRPTARR